LEEQAAAVQALYDEAPTDQDLTEYEEAVKEITAAQAEIQAGSDELAR